MIFHSQEKKKLYFLNPNKLKVSNNLFMRGKDFLDYFNIQSGGQDHLMTFYIHAGTNACPVLCKLRPWICWPDSSKQTFVVLVICQEYGKSPLSLQFASIHTNMNRAAIQCFDWPFGFWKIQVFIPIFYVILSSLSYGWP